MTIHALGQDLDLSPDQLLHRVWLMLGLNPGDRMHASNYQSQRFVLERALVPDAQLVERCLWPVPRMTTFPEAMRDFHREFPTARPDHMSFLKMVLKESQLGTFISWPGLTQVQPGAQGEPLAFVVCRLGEKSGEIYLHPNLSAPPLIPGVRLVGFRPVSEVTPQAGAIQ